MTMPEKYNQHNGYDKYRNENTDGNTTNRGRANYDTDGSLTRLDNYSPVKGEPDHHHHEWLKKNTDGTYSYGYGKHKNH